MEVLNTVDLEPASILVEPSMWQALSQGSLSMHHAQICRAMLWQALDFIPPITLIYATAVVLSES